MANRIKTLPKWLQDQQNNSWQIEILISSGLIYFLYQLPLLFRNEFILHVQAVDVTTEAIILLFSSLTLSRVLLIGFVVNLLLRAIWLGYLGVNFSFPRGIDFRRLGYSDFFKEKEQKRKTTVERIIQLEKYCSLSYSISVFMTIMSLGIFILMYLITTLASLISEDLYNSAAFGYFQIFFLVLAIVGFFDFLFFKVLKKAKRFSRWYYPLYRFFNIISLAFLFKREWQVLLSNISRWKIHGLFLSYFVLAILLSLHEMASYISSPDLPSFGKKENRILRDAFTSRAINQTRYNKHLSKDDKIILGCIEQEVISGNYMYVFVNYWKSLDTYLEYFVEKNQFQLKPNEDYTAEDLSRNDTSFQKVLTEFFVVEIDGQAQDSIYWYRHRHPLTQEIGFKGYFSIDRVEKGPHQLSVSCNYLDEDSDSIKKFSRLKIPFIRE